MSGPTELLDECDALGIKLIESGEGGLTIDAPRDALTSELVERLRNHKAAILAMMRASPPAQNAKPNIGRKLTVATVCRCGSTTWRDVPIHGGRSVRRDCGRCRRFIDFPIWHGKDTGHKDQYLVD